MRGGMEGRGCFPTGLHYPGIAHLLRVQVKGLASEFPSDIDVRKIRYVGIDTETTGRDAAVDRVVELACIIWENGEVVARHGWLINPAIAIPAEVSAIHGIVDADVADKPSFAEILPEVIECLKGALPLAYNADFDRKFILEEVRRAKYSLEKPPPALRSDVEWIDPLLWARELQQKEKSRSLGAVAERLGIALENAHRATDDAVAAMLVMARFFDEAAVPDSYAAFLQEQHRLARKQEEERARWRR